MALYGTLTSLVGQLRRFPEFVPALEYVQLVLREGSAEHARIRALRPGDTERRDFGGGYFANEQACATKPRGECLFESHRRFADIQVIVDGAEWIDLADISRLTVVKPYDAGKDIVFYSGGIAASSLRMAKGDVAVFLPEDGHMPFVRAEGAETVWKTIVKVPIS